MNDIVRLPTICTISTVDFICYRKLIVISSLIKYVRVRLGVTRRAGMPYGTVLFIDGRC